MKPTVAARGRGSCPVLWGCPEAAPTEPPAPLPVTARRRTRRCAGCAGKEAAYVNGVVPVFCYVFTLLHIFSEA